MFKKVVIALFLLLLTVVYVKRDKIIRLFAEDTRTVNKTEVKLLLRQDPSFIELANLLIEKGILADKKHFEEFVNDNQIDTNKFAAGKYVILSKTQLGSLVKGFVKGLNGHGSAEVKVNVVFNNCPTIEAMCKNIGQCILADSSELASYIFSQETLNKYHFTKEQIPAMFLPKDCEMYFDTDAETFVAYMAREFKSFWNAERMRKMKTIGLKSPSEVSTLASIVYSEQSKDNGEWPTIAKLYLNRVQKRMKLESDPTFKFCWGDELKGVEDLRYRHRDIDCPYNTYHIVGLPPGPIYISPSNVLEAVLNPSNVSYLFMMAKPGGQAHNFAVTNREHERNVAVYRKWFREYKRNKNT